MLKVLQKGMLTTIQDLGRRGYQRFGVPVSGALDWYSASLANILVGNDEHTPLFEMTIMGAEFELTEDCYFALCGGLFSCRLNGAYIAQNQCHFAPAGSVLETGMVKSGARGYLAFSGGLDVSLEMGSASTYLRAALGGINGRAVMKGDEIPLKAAPSKAPLGRFAGAELQVPVSACPIVRVLPNEDDRYFDDSALAQLTQGVYTLLPESDRMGCRLFGQEISYRPGCDGNIISDGIAMGSIQVAGGKPIILLAERQPTGGYTKIASVITADLPLVAQLKGGDMLQLKLTDIDTAQELLRGMKSRLSALKGQ